MSSFNQMSVDDSTGIDAMERVQKTIVGLGTVRGVKRVLLVSEEGFPILSARTIPISEDVETVVSAMVAGIVSTFSSACIQLNLGEQVDFIHVQTPLGLGIISKIQSVILVLIADPKVKLVLMHYLVTSTNIKLLKIRDF